MLAACVYFKDTTPQRGGVDKMSWSSVGATHRTQPLIGLYFLRGAAKQSRRYMYAASANGRPSNYSQAA